MYKKALSLRLRFHTGTGPLSLERVMQLTEAQLLSLAKVLEEKTKGDVTSLMEELGLDDSSESEEMKLDKLRFDLVKDILKTKIEQRKAQANLQEKKEQKNLIAGIIAQKKNEKLTEMSIEELQKMLKD